LLINHDKEWGWTGGRWQGRILEYCDKEVDVDKTVGCVSKNGSGRWFVIKVIVK